MTKHWAMYGRTLEESKANWDSVKAGTGMWLRATYERSLKRMGITADEYVKIMEEKKSNT